MNTDSFSNQNEIECPISVDQSAGGLAGEYMTTNFLTPCTVLFVRR